MFARQSPSTLMLFVLGSAAAAQSLDLPGPTGHVTVAATAALVPQAGITVEAWIKPNALGSGRPTVVRKNITANAESYNLRVEFGRPQFSVRAAAGFHTLWPSTSIPIGVATHLAATYDGSTSRLYINGALIGQATHNSGPLVDTGGELRIGKGDDMSGGETFTGQIDAVRIWDHARHPHQVAGGVDRELSFGSGLIASWNLDNDLTDETGAHNGSAVGTTGFASEFATFAKAIRTTQPGGGFVEVPHSAELVPASGLTIEAWIVLASHGGRPTIVRKDPAPYNESYILRVEFGSPQLIIATVLGPLTLWAPGTTVPLNVPVHLAATYDGTRMAMYVNGVLVRSAAVVGGALRSSTGSLRIGKGDDLPNSGGELFQGSIDSVRIWRVGLEASDIAYLRDREVSGLPGLIASWDFNGDLTDSTGSHHGVAVGGTVGFVEQFGDQIGAPATGLLAFGAPSSPCGILPRMYAASLPENTNANFAFGSTHGSPSSLWLHVIGVGGLTTAQSVLGLDLWIDPAAALVTTLGVGDRLGSSRQRLPLPTQPAYVGLELFAQAAWFDAACGAAGIAASDGLRITIRD